MMFLLTYISGIKPYFTEKGRMKRTYLLIPAGHDAKIVCSAAGSPIPTVTWYKNGKKLKYMPDGSTPLTPSSFAIKFNMLKPGHSGKYKCVVSNEFGNITMEYTVKVKGIVQNIFLCKGKSSLHLKSSRREL